MGWFADAAREATRKVCGVLVAMLLGQSGSYFAERTTVNTGTVLDFTRSLMSNVD